MKKLHRFYLSDLPTADTFEITDSALVHQLATVLRYAIGEQFIVFGNGSDDIVVQIDELSKKVVVVHVVDRISAIHPPRHIIAAVSIIKRDLFELVVEKLTELGVREIVPVLSSRTIKQSTRLDRLELISREAIEQSGQNTLVTIHNPMTLSDALNAFPFPSVVFDPRESESQIEAAQKMVLYIGPEGGWSDIDLEVFKQHKHIYYKKLGDTILRTETAAIVGAYTILSL